MANHQNKRNTNKNTKTLPLAIAAALLAVVAVVVPRTQRVDQAEEVATVQQETTQQEVVTTQETSVPERKAIAQGEVLTIPVDEVTEEASFYPVSVDGTDMEVLAVRASDGTVRTAFNTCQSCFTSGAGFYRFEGGELVCNNCGFHFAPDDVGVSAGGCNPWPILEGDKVTDEKEITISYDFLSESKAIFANWKTAVY